MYFLNSNPNRLFKTKSRLGQLYYYGYTNTSWDYICKILDQGDFPKNLKGQFAFVYINGKNWIACVDHLCTTQLFYTKDKIDCNFDNIVAVTKNLHQNTDNLKQLEILKSHTVGPETPYKEILRIEPETYVKNGYVYRYSDILNEPLQVFEVESVYEKFVEVCKKYPLNESTLLFSGGKDSGWLALLLKHLSYDIDLVHIHSPNSKNTIDFDATKCYEKECGFDIKYYPVNILPTSNETFWRNAQFLTKSKAAATGQGAIKLSGEVGGTLMGHSGWVGPLLANGNTDIDNYIKTFISVQHQWNKKGISTNIDDTRFGNLVKTQAWEQIFEYFRKKIQNIDKPDSYKFYNFCINEFSSHRLYAETQDIYNTWFNIFSDYDIQNAFINSTWNTKYKSNYKKYHLYKIGKLKFTNWTDISWRYPAIGMSIPNDRTFRQFTTI